MPTSHAKVTAELHSVSTEVTLLSTMQDQRKPARNEQLAQRVQRVLDDYFVQPLNTRDDAPWSLMHWSIAYGVDAMVCMGEPEGKPVTAIGWLCSNYPARGADDLHGQTRDVATSGSWSPGA